MDSGILPSRQELLSRIELVCDLNSSFIAITGESGVGKSALLEFFIEHHCASSKKCFIQAQDGQSLVALKEQILGQLLNREKYDPYLSFTENFSFIDPRDAIKAIIIFDNAQHIDIELFEELTAVLKSGQLAIELSVIFAQTRDPDRINQLNSRHPLIEFHLEALSDEESRLLLNLYYPMIDGDKSQVQQFIDKSAGLPGRLLKYQSEPEPEPKKAFKPSKQAIVLALAGFVLLCVLAVASWYFVSNQQTVDPRQEIAERVAEQQAAANEAAKEDQSKTLTAETAAETTPETTAAKPLPSESDLLRVTQMIENLAEPQVDSTVEPQADNAEPEPQAESPDSQTSAADKLDKLLVKRFDHNPAPVEFTDDSTDEVTEPEQPSDLTDAKADTNTDADTEAVEQVETQTAKPEPEVEEAVAAPVEAPVTVPVETAALVVANNNSPDGAIVTVNEMDNQWFLSQRANLYVIQLTGISDQQLLDDYLTDHRLKATAHIYRSVRDNHPWYVVTLGVYSSFQAAKDAIGALSAPLRATQPWVKSISTIQLEIVNANKTNE
ncbi:MAG: septal ring-binding cell division protein DamX [Phenylobacterium sp.]|jgi:septal ring-binding cell division protein DamX